MDNRVDFATDDPERAHEVLSRIYTGYRFRMHHVQRRFSYRQQSVRAGPITLSRVRYTMDVTVQFRTTDSFIFVVLADGLLETRDGRDTAVTRPGDVLLHRPGRALTNLCSDFDMHGLTLDAAVVAETAAARTGTDRAGFRFDAMTPVSRDQALYWRHTMAYLYNLFTADAEPLHNPLAVSAATDLAATAALVTFPNTAMAAPHRPATGPAPPAAVRRAVSFIETHLAEPLTATRIADAARITPRALQAAFRRHLDTTPMAYLRRTRLDRAHHDLLAADPTDGATVTAIAHRWGYLDLSRFAADYRSAYGHSPRTTLLH
ncbi:helix-turn-helix transcriptional regulator [Paractinoplanes lichenicola]|uniref:AraC family transcriptional regulator n=1 Tax=Paractinoplanes lichenicola TaxID=2802976 RepID=A0ABS1W662_9ACTN|nr:AraC family transcriptional regulator [Actinoplanes lichenicola]MBL7262221.1 AraC family transcriptional regulator [Actinoplanes lichenicola]